jgi:hypothetical protein
MALGGAPWRRRGEVLGIGPVANPDVDEGVDMVELVECDVGGTRRGREL